MVQEKIQVGMIVDYKLKEGLSIGQVRPAIVVRLWDSGLLNLQVFTDDSNDSLSGVYWATSVEHGAKAGQWEFQSTK